MLELATRPPRCKASAAPWWTLRMSREGGKHRINWTLIGFFVIVAFFLLSEHRTHALGALPYLLLLTWPLLPIFMRRGHGGGHRHD